MQRLVKNTGVVFGALTENEEQLQNLITGAKRTFDATASKNDELAETIRIFPTFLDESKLTLARVQRFSRDTDPLITDLRPVARDLQPTLRDVKALAPDLERFFDEPRPGHHGVQEGPARHARGARRRGAAARRARPVPRRSSTRSSSTSRPTSGRSPTSSASAPPRSRRRTESPGGGERPLPAPVRPARAPRASRSGRSARRPTAATPTSSRSASPPRGPTPARPTTSSRSPGQFDCRNSGASASADRRRPGLLGPEPEPVRLGQVPVPGQGPGLVPARRGRRLLRARLPAATRRSSC